MENSELWTYRLNKLRSKMRFIAPEEDMQLIDSLLRTYKDGSLTEDIAEKYYSELSEKIYDYESEYIESIREKAYGLITEIERDSRHCYVKGCWDEDKVHELVEFLIVTGNAGAELDKSRLCVNETNYTFFLKRLSDIVNEL